MPVVSAGDLTLLRGQQHRSDVYTSFLVPPILWQARINDGSIVQGETSIAFDGGSGSFFSMVEELQDLWVGVSAGKDDVGGDGNGRLRIKSISSGDGGVTGTVVVGGHSLPLQDTQYLTFKHDYPLRPRWSFIDPSTEIWYMDDDIVYVDQHEEPPPVVIAGPHRAGFLVGGSFVINVDAASSYTIAQGATKSSYALTVASTAGSPTVNFNTGTGLGDITFSLPGYYWAKYSVTDSNGKTQISYRCYIVHDNDPSLFYPYVDARIITLAGDWSTGGWIAGIESHDSHTFDDIPNHTLAIMWRDSWYGTTKKNITFLPDSASTIFAGYVRGEAEEQDLADGMGNVDLILSTIDGRLGRIYAFSASLVAQQSGINHWGEIPNWHTVGTIVHTLLRWRSTLFEVTDVIGLRDNTWRRVGYEPDDNNLYEMVNNFSFNEGIRARLVCDQGGRMHFTHDMQLMIASERAGLSTAFDLQKDVNAADYGGSLIIPRAPEPEAPFVTSNGIYWDGTTWDGDGRPEATGDWCVIAPGGKPLHEGPSPKDFPKQTIPSLAYLRELAGRYLGKTNNPIEEIRLDFAGDYLGVLDIAYDDATYDISLATGDTPRGQVLTNHPLYCRNIAARFTGEEGVWSVEASFEPFSEGITGVETECPSFPPLGGIIPVIPLPAQVPGALMTGASVHYKGATGNAWTQRISQDVKALTPDPFWRIKTSSADPSDSIVFRCGLGYIKRTTDGFISTDVDVTPGTNPPNDAGDSPAPSRLTVTYTAIEGSFVTQGRFAAVVNWQNSSNEWRTWLVYTTDDGSTWTWGYLGEIACPANCLDPSQTETANTDPPSANPTFHPGFRTIVEINTDKYAWVYVDLGGESIAQIFTVNTSTGVFTFGARYEFIDFAIDLRHYNRMHIAFVSTDKFAVYHDAFYKWTELFGKAFMYVTVMTVSGTTVSSHENNVVISNWEASEYQGGVVIGEIFRHQYGSVWSDGGTNMYVTTYFKVLDSSCDPPAGTNYSLVTLAGTLSGNTITWADTTCDKGAQGIKTVRDWQIVKSNVGPNPEDIEIVDSDGGTHSVMIYWDDSDDDFKVQAFTSGSYGAAVQLPNSDDYGIYPTVFSDWVLIRLSDTLSILAAQWIDWGAGDDTVHVWALSRSGTTMTAGARFDLSLDDGLDDLARLSNSTFIMTGYQDQFSECDCIAAWKFSVSGTTISLTEDCGLWHDDTANVALTVAPDAKSSTDIISMARKNYAGDTNWPGLYIDVQSLAPCPTTATEIKSLGLAMGSATGTYAWVTAGNDTELEMLRVTLSSMAITRFSLGNATIAQMNSQTYLAYPVVPFGFESTVYILGRMNNPDGLGDPVQIIRTDNGGSSFNLIEDSWGADHCGSLTIGIDGRTYAIRNRSGQAKLYRDSGDSILILRLTFPWAGKVAPKGMYVSRFTTDVYVAAWVSNSFMVSQVPPPHWLEKDITFDHATTDPIEAIIQL